VDELVDFVLEQTTSPVNTWAVAATLESGGVRDVDAQQRYGDADVFALADRVYAGCRTRLVALGDPVVPAAASSDVRAVLGRYGRGLVSGLPMLVQTFSVLLLAFVLYALLGYDEERASVVALATLSSLVVTGGFVQVIGRLAVYYTEQGSFRLAQEVSWRLVRYGVTAATAVGLVLVAINAVTGWWLPAVLVVGALVYYALLTVLWLLLAVLYAMRLRLSIVVVFLGTAVVAAVTDRLVPSTPELAHWSGLLAADLGAAVWARRSLRRRAAQEEADGVVRRLPRQAIHAYSVAPYFLYGLLYFSFLFLDRLLAWTVGGHPLPFWFDAGYEVGLDLALIVLVLMLPQLEYAVHAFADSMTPVQTSYLAAQAKQHNSHYLRFYLRQLLLLVVMGAGAMGLVTAGVLGLGELDLLPGDGVLTWYVFLCGALGYALLVVALLNGVFLFSLSRPWPAVVGLSVALLCNGGVGWVLSRQGEHWWSVGGLVVGAAVFACMSSVATVRVLRRLDYHYYAAY
jgi:hypothetical protein